MLPVRCAGTEQTRKQLNYEKTPFYNALPVRFYSNRRSAGVSAVEQEEFVSGMSPASVLVMMLR